MENDKSSNTWEITSIGALCANKWRVCLKTGFEYVPCLFENIKNTSVHQFENMVKLIEGGFEMISVDHLSDWQEKRTVAYRIDVEKMSEYRGYVYVGNELAKPFSMPHFFDTKELDFLSFDEGWARWDHKVHSFNELLSDLSRKLILVNLRVTEDLPDERKTLAEGARIFTSMLRNKYGRSENDTLVVNEIVCLVNKTEIEVDEPMLLQFTLPDRDDEINVKYFKRDWNDRRYADSLVEMLGKRGIEK